VVDLHQVSFLAPFLLNNSPRRRSHSLGPILFRRDRHNNYSDHHDWQWQGKIDSQREQDLAITLLKRRLHPLYSQPLVKRSPVTPASQPPHQDQLNSNKKECEKINKNVSYLINKKLSYLVLAGGPLSRRPPARQRQRRRRGTAAGQPPDSVVEVLGIAVGVVLEGGGDGRSGRAADVLALPQQPPEQPAPGPAAGGVVTGEQLEPCRAAAHARRQPRGGRHAAREVGGVGRRGRLAVHVHGHERAR
jgi:hypothetical protein